MTSDNKPNSLATERNGDIVMNWRCEYFVDGPDSAKGSLNSGNTLLDGHCLENLYSAAGGSGSQVTGILLAEYTYSAYVDVLIKSGELAQKNPMRFSTRYTEDASLYYYGYRHYSPNLRKCTLHEPLGEEATRNLNSFSQNNPYSPMDINGNVAVALPRITAESFEISSTIVESSALSNIFMSFESQWTYRRSYPCWIAIKTFHNPQS